MRQLIESSQSLWHAFLTNALTLIIENYEAGNLAFIAIEQVTR